MIDNTMRRVAATAMSVRQSRPRAPALEVLDLAFEGHAPSSFDPVLTHPGSRLGQVIAEAFDRAMTPAEWAAWTSAKADPALRDTMLRIWGVEVMPHLRARYKLLG